MNSIENAILDIIKNSPSGVRTSEISRILSIKETEINLILQGKLKAYCKLDMNYRWHYINKQDNSSKLKNLCRYYLNCLTLEENNNIVVHINDKFETYMETQYTDERNFKNPDIIKFITKTTMQNSIITSLLFNS